MVAVLEARITAVSSLLLCDAEAAAQLLLGHAGLAAATDAHLMERLLTLQQLLPGADIARLVRGNVELLLREDAMERARQAVEVLTANGLDPSVMVTNPLNSVETLMKPK
uniref:Uncharacterized protein n=1 Tax=Pyramimonas obovata TaxID=1411642 RepID=A0A7S0N9T1_9CHLO|mmetsp:Transcript_23503/g.51376  ORF Transcript_23503/g.51376 Transcript_23503/m.51376 type:complete len:110 (+) Transcript_23503:394-723(+)